MRFYPIGGGGGADLDVVTAGAEHVLAPKVIVDKDGNPITGVMINRTGTALTVATNGKALIPQGYHDGTQYATNSQATLAGGTLTPSTSQVTVNCNGKLMTSNYVIQAFSLPSASIILSGKKVTIYGKSVTGTAIEYVQDSDIYPDGGTKPSFTVLNGTLSPYNTYIQVENKGKIRINNTIDLTKYRYLHCKVCGETGSETVTCVVSKNSDGSNPAKTATYKSGSWGEAIIDVSSLTGQYYLVMYVNAASLYVRSIYLSTT